MLAERARTIGDDAAAREAEARAKALAARLAGLLEPAAWRGSPPPESLVWRQACEAEARRAAGEARASNWAAVAQSWADLGRPLEEAYARLREAECLVLDGERKAAEAALSMGLRITGECRAAWLREELESLARRGRLSLPEELAPDGATATDAVESLGLTDRELEVLELVATGLTNRQIGERLFMAERTAGVHVSRILTKLGVSSRVEAATAAQRLGIAT
jgi:ATP/maltotriose-dependent transcriptional regulator MalT